MKHKPTPLPMREAALRHLAERLIQYAKAWGYTVAIDPVRGVGLARIECSFEGWLSHVLNLLAIDDGDEWGKHIVQARAKYLFDCGMPADIAANRLRSWMAHP